jgi:hypothetical protein
MAAAATVAMATEAMVAVAARAAAAMAASLVNIILFASAARGTASPDARGKVSKALGLPVDHLLRTFAAMAVVDALWAACKPSRASSTSSLGRHCSLLRLVLGGR